MPQNRATFKRPRDGLIFSFDAALGDDSTHAAVAIVTADATATHLLKPETCNMAAKAAATLCIALTKADVVPRDYSSSHIQALINKARVAYMTNLDAILVDSTSMDGTCELIEYIGCQPSSCIAVMGLTPRLGNAVSPAQQSYTVDVANLCRLGRSMILDWIAACFRLPTAADLPLIVRTYGTFGTTMWLIAL